MLQDYILIAFCLFFISSCNPDKNRVVDRDQPRFETTDATRIPFKNVRLLYYHFEDQNEGKIQVYRLKSRIEDPSKPVINVDIVNNWYQDRAYPMVQFSEYYKDRESILIGLMKDSGDSEEIELRKDSPIPEHFYFTAAIYEGIINNYNITLLPEKVQVFQSQDEKEGFRITMVDFYRLVGIY